MEGAGLTPCLRCPVPRGTVPKAPASLPLDRSVLATSFARIACHLPPHLATIRLRPFWRSRPLIMRPGKLPELHGSSPPHHHTLDNRPTCRLHAPPMQSPHFDEATRCDPNHHSIQSLEASGQNIFSDAFQNLAHCGSNNSEFPQPWGHHPTLRASILRV